MGFRLIKKTKLVISQPFTCIVFGFNELNWFRLWPKFSLILHLNSKFEFGLEFWFILHLYSKIWYWFMMDRQNILSSMELVGNSIYTSCFCYETIDIIFRLLNIYFIFILRNNCYHTQTNNLPLLRNNCYHTQTSNLPLNNYSHSVSNMRPLSIARQLLSYSG